MLTPNYALMLDSSYIFWRFLMYKQIQNLTKLSIQSKVIAH